MTLAPRLPRAVCLDSSSTSLQPSVSTCNVWSMNIVYLSTCNKFSGGENQDGIFLFVYCYCPPCFSKRGGHSNSFIRPSVPLSLCHKNFKVHIFSNLMNRGLIFGTHVPRDKPFWLAPCHDLGLHFSHVSRSNLLQRGRLQFCKIASLSLS